MYSKEELKNIVEKIENDDVFSDLDINERIFVITLLLKNTNNLIADYMIDTKEDEKFVKLLNNIIKSLKNIDYIGGKNE